MGRLVVKAADKCSVMYHRCIEFIDCVGIASITCPFQSRFHTRNLYPAICNPEMFKAILFFQVHVTGGRSWYIEEIKLLVKSAVTLYYFTIMWGKCAWQHLQLLLRDNVTSDYGKSWAFFTKKEDREPSLVSLLHPNDYSPLTKRRNFVILLLPSQTLQ